MYTQLQKILIIIIVRKHRLKGFHAMDLYMKPAYNGTARDRNLFPYRQVPFHTGV